MKLGKKVHLGCGWHHMKGYVNVDKYVPHRIHGFDVHCDAGEYMRMVPPGTVEEVISKHMIEHIHRERAVRLMNQCFRAMKSGGRLILECPDLLASCRRFVESDGVADPNGIYGAHRSVGDTHLWGYSQPTLRRLVEEAGFVVEGLGGGTDRHVGPDQPCIRLEAVKP